MSYLPDKRYNQFKIINYIGLGIVKISILHISDIHFKDKDNSIEAKKIKLFDAIKNEITEYENLFIVITGDIAFSGKKEEYAIAKIFLHDIKNLINEYNPDINIEYIFTEGNHDCDFSANKSARDIIMKTLIQNPKLANDELVDICTSPQVEYMNFIQSFSSFKNINQSLSNKLLHRYEYKLNEYKISFNAFNLAWVSKQPEKQSEIIFPLNYIKESELLDLNFDLSISIQHHPFHWLKHNNIRDFRDFVDNLSDIVLTGHEHTMSISKKQNILKDTQTEHIEGGTLQNSYDPTESEFNLILIDVEHKKHNLLTYTWIENLYQKTEIEDIDLPSSIKSSFQFQAKYKEKITSLGLNVEHPRQDDVILENLFIFPRLEIIDIKDKENEDVFLQKSSEEFTKIVDLGLNIFYGADNSGKTALANTLQISYKQKGLVPIILSGGNFTKYDFKKNKISDAISKAFKSQYLIHSRELDLFNQLDNKNKIIIIDDFQNIKLNSEFKAIFIKNLIELNYKQIMVFSSDCLRYEATSEGDLAKSFYIFKHYQIKSFGHKLRDELITKWIKLGQESEIEDIEVANIRRIKADAIAQTIGLNMVPSSPVYILTLLQAMEIHDTSLDKSSYGHYYYFLIMQYLNSNRDKIWESKDINTIFSYTSNLAFKMFTEKEYSFTKNELLEFDVEYKKEVDFEPVFNILNTIINSGILSEYDGNYKFSQKYIYYYFVGYFFSQNTDNENITKIIEEMIKRLHRSEFGNILMFILHLSQKNNIIKMLNDEAKKAFSKFEEFEFRKDELEKLNNSVKKDTTLKLKKKTIDEARDEELEIKEEEDKYKQVVEVEENNIFDIEEDIDNLDFFKQMNSAFKLIEILGEVVKNYSGTLKGNIKNELITNTYGIGLRSLKVVIGAFEEHHEMLVENIGTIIKKKNNVTKDKIDSTIHSFVFSLASTMATDTIKKISTAVGSQDLKKTYRRISDESSGNLAYSLIQYAIDLDFPKGLNIKNITELHAKLSGDGNVLTDSSLKALVLNHLDMYEVSYKEKTSICAKIDINVDSSKRKMIEKKT